jgi:hypothetical protein
MPLPDTAASQRPEPAVFWRWVWSSVRPFLGHVLVAVGLLLLLSAYLGVSREVLVARQLPYVVSGGLFGLAAVTFGSRLMLIEDLRRDSGRLARLELAVTELHEVLLSRADAPASRMHQPSASRNGVPRTPAQLVALGGAEAFHRNDCPIVEGKPSAAVLTRQAAQKKGLSACKLCQPLSAGV